MSEGDDMGLGINALYGSCGHARSARSTLVAAGIPEGTIRLIVCPPVTETKRDEEGEVVLDADVLRGSLGEIGLPHEAWEAYRSKLAGGGAMLNLTVRTGEAERVMGILKDHGSVDVEQRVATWRAEGWGGTSPVSTEGWGGYSATSTGGTDITANRED